MDSEELVAFLKENLRLDVNVSSCYNGGMDDGPMYNEHTTIALILDGEIISEVTVS